MCKDDVMLLGFKKEYPTLNLKVKKENEILFDFGLIFVCGKECDNGFKVKKINKTTNKGTMIYYTRFQSKDDVAEYKEKMEEMINNFYKKYLDKINDDAVLKDKLIKNFS